MKKTKFTIFFPRAFPTKLIKSTFIVKSNIYLFIYLFKMPNAAKWMQALLRMEKGTSG